MLSFLRCEWQAKYGTGTSSEKEKKSILVIYPKVSPIKLRKQSKDNKRG